MSEEATHLPTVPLSTPLHPLPSQDGRYPLNPDAAVTVARLVTAIRGAGKPHTTPAECRSLDAAFFADLYQVRPDAQLDPISSLTSCPTEPSG